MRALRKPQLRAVRTRTTIAATLIVTLALVLGSVALVLLQRDQLLRGLESTATQEATVIAGQIAEDGVDDIDTSVLQSSGNSRIDLEVVDAADNVVFATDDDDFPDDVRDPRDGEVRTEVAGEDGRDYVVASVQVRDDDGDAFIVRSAQRTGGVDDSTTVLIVLLSLGIPLIAVLVALSTYWLVGRALAPVEAIRSRVAQISSANESAQVPVPNSGDEVARLAETMNSMLARMEASAAAQRRFVSDASHELRSPLASMRMTTELASQHPEAMPWDEASESVLAETVRLQALVSDLLLLANSDEGQLRTQASDVDLDDLVQQEAERLRREGRSRVTVQADAVRVSGDPHHLIRAIRNLVDNADRHAESAVQVRLSSDASNAYLDVVDDGIGVPSDQQERIFDRFVRLDDSRQRDSGGSGLGLAITREIARLHGGSVAVMDRADGARGAQFRLTIPLA